MRGRRNKTVSQKELRRERRLERLAGESAGAEELAELERVRPRVRGDCADGPRPCPWAGCRHHLLLDVTPAGSLQLNYPGQEVEELAESCALDVADRGGMTMEKVGELLNVTRSRVEQIEHRALTALRAAPEAAEITTLPQGPAALAGGRLTSTLPLVTVPPRSQGGNPAAATEGDHHGEQEG